MSFINRSFFAITLVVLLALALLALTAPRAAAADYPSDPATIARQARSTPSHIDWEYAWDETSTGEGRFFFIVPRDRKVTGALLEAEIAIGELGAAATGAPPAVLNLAAFKKKHASHQPALEGLFRRVTEVGVMRHFRVVDVKVKPELFRAGKTSGQLRRFKARLTFDRPADAPGQAGGHPLFDPALPSHGAFQETMRRLVSNPDALALYASAEFPAPALAGLEPRPRRPLTDGVPALLRIGVERDGFYKIDAEVLRGAGVDPTAVNPQHVRVFNNGVETPTFLVGGILERFTAKDSLVFYATENDSAYTRANTYFIAIDAKREAARIPRVQDRLSSPVARPDWHYAELVLEEDLQLITHTDNFLSIVDYNWVGRPLPLNKEETLRFDCPFLVKGRGEDAAQTQVSFYLDEASGESTAEIQLDVNGARSRHQVKSNKQREFTFKLEYSRLREKDNVLKLRRVDRAGGGPEVYFDRLAFRYPRAMVFRDNAIDFTNAGLGEKGAKTYAINGRLTGLPLALDVTDTAQPRLLPSRRTTAGALAFDVNEDGAARYAIVSLDDVRRPDAIAAPILTELYTRDKPVEYLIVSHRDFLEPAQRLADFHAGRGLRAEVVDVRAVYNNFSYGQKSPLAIKAFLSHAARHWPAGGPLYVLLMGDATSDYRGDFRNQVPNFLPTYTLERGENLERWGSDHWFTTVLGEDEYPDLILGRFSVAEITDAFTVVNKTIQYLDDPAPGPWRQHLLVVSDDGFSQDVDQLRQKFMPPHFAVTRVYLDEQPLADNFYLPRNLVEAENMKVSPVATTKIMNAFNRGAIFASYHGHGSPNIWTDERIWFGGGSQNSDNLLLTNRARPPFLVNMTCNTGAIDYPQRPWNICIAEDFMRVKNGGIIGGYLPSGPGTPNAHERMCSVMFNVFLVERFDRVGPALLLTKYRYLALNYPLELVQMFMHLGDPTLQLPWPERIERGTVEPSACLAGTTHTVRLTHRFADLKNGRARVDLFDDHDRLVQSVKDAPLTKGRLEAEVTIPPDARPGDWHVRAYAYAADDAGAASARRKGAEAGGRISDRAVWAPIHIDTPFVKITDFQMKAHQPFARRGEKLEYEITVANESWLAVEDGHLMLTGHYGKREYRTLDFACAAKKGVVLKGTWPAANPPGDEPFLQTFSVRLEGRQSPHPAGGQPAARQTAAVVVGEPRTDQQVLLSADACVPNAVQYKTSLSVDAPLYAAAVGRRDSGPFTVYLSAGDRQKISARVPSLRPGEAKEVALRGTLQLRSLPARLDSSCSPPHLIAGDAASPAKTGQGPPVALTKARLPELKIDAAGVRSRPAKPTDGETIFFTLPVLNTGGSVVDKVTVAVYDRNPAASGARPLESAFAVGKPTTVRNLQPGERREIEVRWDPQGSNAGRRQVWFKIDGADQLVEADEKNNLASCNVYARTKQQLKYIGRQVEGAGPGRIRISAKIVNQGETDAHHVMVEFFNALEQTPATKMGEGVLLPRVAAQSEIIVPYLHKLTPAELEDLRETKGNMTVTVRVGLKGSLQRIKSEGVQ